MICQIYRPHLARAGRSTVFHKFATARMHGLRLLIILWIRAELSQKVQWRAQAGAWLPLHRLGKLRCRTLGAIGDNVRLPKHRSNSGSLLASAAWYWVHGGHDSRGVHPWLWIVEGLPGLPKNPTSPQRRRIHIRELQWGVNSDAFADRDVLSAKYPCLGRIVHSRWGNRRWDKLLLVRIRNS